MKKSKLALSSKCRTIFQFKLWYSSVIIYIKETHFEGIKDQFSTLF